MFRFQQKVKWRKKAFLEQKKSSLQEEIFTEHTKAEKLFLKTILYN
jgi:hypothetical protein